MLKHNRKGKIALFGAILLVMLCLPNFSSSVNTVDIFQEDKDLTSEIDPEIDPNSAYQYHSNQIDTNDLAISEDQSNFGIFMEANSEVIGGQTDSDWNLESGAYYTDNPWKLELPTQMNNIDWQISGGSVSVFDMTKFETYLPSSSGNFRHFDPNEGWNYPGTSTYSYVDNYWEDGLTSTDYAVAQTTQTPIKSFSYTSNGQDSYGPSAQLQLSTARRTHTLKPSDVNQLGISTSSNNQPANYGLSTYYNEYYNIYHSYSTSSTTNWQLYSSSTTESHNTGSTNPAYSSTITAQRIDSQDGFYIEGKRDIYYYVDHTYSKPSTHDYYGVKADLGFSHRDTYTYEYNWQFFYNSSTRTAQTALANVDVDLTKIGHLNDNFDNGHFTTQMDSGFVRYTFYKPTGDPLTPITNNIVGSGTGSNWQFDQSSADLVNYDLGSAFFEEGSSGIWTLKINVQFILSYKAGQGGKLESVPPISNHGDSTSPRVTIGPSSYPTVGMGVNVKNVGIYVDEGVTIDDQPNVEDSYIERVITSDEIDWRQRSVGPDEPVILTYEYYIPTTVAGYSGNNGLEGGFMFATLTIKDTQNNLHVFERQSDLHWGQIRTANRVGLGTGKMRYEWDMRNTENLISSLNNSQSITFEIGARIYDNFQLHRDTTSCSVFYRNIDFSFTSISSAEIEDLRLYHTTSGGLRTGGLQFQDIIGSGRSEITFSEGSPLLTNYWTSDSQIASNGFIFHCESIQEFNYTAVLYATYKYWDSEARIILTPGKTIIEVNASISTPKPYTYGQYYGDGFSDDLLTIDDSKWIEPWNNNFNLSFIVPKYVIGENIYWNLDYGMDYNRPDGPIKREGSRNEIIWDAQPHLYLYVDGNPNDNNMGDSVKMGTDYQRVYVDNAVFYGYTRYVSSVNPGIDEMDWGLLFEAPNDAKEITIDNDNSFENNLDTFYYSSTAADYVHIQLNKETGLHVNDANVKGYFMVYNDNENKYFETFAGLTGDSTSFSTDNLGVNPYQISSEDNLVEGWSASGFLLANNYLDESRVAGNNWLSGIYRGGMNYSVFDVQMRTELANLNLTNCIENYIGENNSYNNPTWLFNSTEFDLSASGDMNNMINLSIQWLDASAEPITDADLYIAISNYRAISAGTIIRDYETAFPDFNPPKMNDAGDGTYWILLDPMDMDRTDGTGNITWGYHDIEIRAEKTGFETTYYEGNFSVLVETELLYNRPSSSPEYIDAVTGLPRFDRNGAVAGEPYILDVTYKMASDTAFYIDNTYNSYYAGNVFIMYNLTGVYEHTPGMPSVSFDNYVNELYFENQFGENPLNVTGKHNWPSIGFMETDQGNNRFISSIQWPNYKDADYATSESFTDYYNQDTSPKFLEYEFTAYVRINRTDQSTSSLFQPNNVQKIHSQKVYLLLNDPSVGNYSRIIPTNIETLDGEGYNMGVYNNNSQNIMSYTPGVWSPEFLIRNYQNNVTYESNNLSYPNHFRIRVILNCSRLLDEDITQNTYPAGYQNISETVQKWRPYGPLNDTVFQYGVNQSSWMGNTTIRLQGWDTDKSIDFLPDYDTLWSTTVRNMTDDNDFDFTAYGITYVTPWLSLEDRETGTHVVEITGNKEGFVIQNRIMYIDILEAPTVLLNGSSEFAGEPNIFDDSFGEAAEDNGYVYPANDLHLTIPRGAEISQMLNFSDITNFGTGDGTVGIEDADFTCYHDTYTGNYWLNARNRWKLEDEGNGMYNLTLFSNASLLEVENPNGRSFLLLFSASKTNYTTIDFTLNLTIMKRTTEMRLINQGDIFEDYYYARASGENPDYLSAFSVSKINFSIQIIDEFTNLPITLSQSDIETRLSFRYGINPNDLSIMGGSLYEIDTYITGGNMTINITVATTLLPNEYHISINMTSVTNYFDSGYLGEFEILKGIADAELVFNAYHKDTVPFYKLDNGQTAIDAKLPQYEIKVFDTNHNYSDKAIDGYANTPILFWYDSLGGRPEASSDFNNEVRTSNMLDGALDYKYGLPTGRRLVSFTIDISGINVSSVDGDYQQRFFDVTLEITHEGYLVFEPIVITLNYTIVNASTQIYTGDFVDNSVVVAGANRENAFSNNFETYNNPAIIKQQHSSYFGQHQNYPFPQDIPYGFLVQVWFGYRATKTQENEFVGAMDSNEINLSVSVNGPETEYLGITPHFEANPEGFPFSSIWFWAEQDIEEYGINFQANYTFHVSALNYEPISYNISFRIVQHESSARRVQFQNRLVPFHGEAVLRFEYYDESLSYWGEEATINNALVYTDNIEDGVGHTGEGTYVFPDGQTVEFRVERITAGEYEIRFDLTGLDIKEDAYYINLNVGVLSGLVQSKQLLTHDLELPSFNILPARTNLKIWLRTQDTAPDPLNDESTSFILIGNKTQVEYVYIWVQLYIELDNEIVPLTDQNANFTVQVNLFNQLNETNDAGIPEEELVYTLYLEYDATIGLWKGQVKLTETGLDSFDDYDIDRVGILRFNVTSDNLNYDDLIGRTDVIIAQAGGIIQEIPPAFYILLAISLGIVAIVGGYGINKALKLRIPYVLRMIDDTIDKIEKDKFPGVGVMMGRQDYIINKVIDYLDMCDIEWAIDDKFEEEELGDVEEGDEEASGEPLSIEEITGTLNKIESLSPDERLLFIEELKTMGRKEQLEFLETLKED